MHTFPPAGFPMSAGGTPVQGVPGIGRPQGVMPSPGMAGFPTGFPGGAPPAIFPQPGPATLGPSPRQGSGPGGVAGVSMGPVASVVPPVATGGPHQLPPLPSMPLPQGFPNPFGVQQVGAGSPAPAQMNAGPPGTTTVAGPQGYFPGIGQVGGYPSAPPPPTAFPMLPGAQAGYPVMSPAPPIQPASPPAQQATGQPFWLQLAWQLVQTPAVQQTLGDRIQHLLAGPERSRTLQVATTCLLGKDLQDAFRAMSGGALAQDRFTERFAESLRAALTAGSML